jgi:hypothetical protein
VVAESDLALFFRPVDLQFAQGARIGAVGQIQSVRLVLFGSVSSVAVEHHHPVSLDASLVVGLLDDVFPCATSTTCCLRVQFLDECSKRVLPIGM